MKIIGIIFLILIALIGIMGMILNAPFVSVGNQRLVIVAYGVIALVAILVLIALQPRD